MLALTVALFTLTAPPSSPSSPKLAVDLYAQLRSTPGNFACSPASVRTALAVTQLGARGNTAKDAAVVALPYEDGGRLVVVVPAQRAGLASLESKLAKLLATTLREQPVRVAMPRFHVVTQTSVVPALRALGIKNAWCTDDAKP